VQDRRMVTMDHLYSKALVTYRIVTRVTTLNVEYYFCDCSVHNIFTMCLVF